MSGVVQIFSLIPYPDAVSPQVGGVGAVQTGDPDSGVQIHGLVKGGHHMLVPPPILGGPGGAVIVIDHVLRGKASGIIAPIGQTDVADVGIVQNSLCGDTGGPLILYGLRSSLIDGGMGALTHVVARHHIDRVSHVVLETFYGGPGLCQPSSGLLPAVGSILLVVDLIIGGDLALFPGKAQRGVKGGNVYHVYLVGGAGGNGGGFLQRGRI